jgi:hypothetical protein
VLDAPGFRKELERLQSGVWPSVLEQRKRLDEADGTTPLGLLGRPRLLVVRGE